MARILGPKPFGLIALASAFTYFLQIFIDQGMTEAIIQEPALDEQHLNAAFLTNMIWSLCLSTITWVGANFIAELYKEPLLSPVLRWLSLGFVISAFSSTQISYLRKQLQFRNLAIRSVISKSVAAIVAVVFAYLGFGVWSLVAQLLVMNVLGAIILWSSSDWRPTIRFSQSHFQSLFIFGIQITASRILAVINAQLHDFIIGYFMDATSLGLFSVANTLTKRLVDIIRNVILEVAYPAFSRLQYQPLRLRIMFSEVSRITAVIIFPIFTFIFLTAPELVIVLFGPEWSTATQLIRLLALTGGVYALIAYFSQMLMAIGQTKPLLISKLITLVVNGLGLALSLQFGIVAVTGAYVASWYIIFPLYYYYVNRHIGLKGYMKHFSPTVIGIIVMSLATSFVRLLARNHVSSIILLLISCIVGILSYILTLLVTSPKTIFQLYSMAKIIISKPGNITEGEINLGLNDVSEM